MKKKIMVIYGTRPELIKLAPVILELKKYPQDFELFQLATAQHREMLDQVLEIFALKPDRDLNIMVPNQTLEQLSSSVMLKVSAIFAEIEPQLVMIQGDTTTAMISALAAFYKKIAVAHVEAGLRTGDIYNPFPEEINRKVVATLAAYHFPPTKLSSENLKNEGVPASHIVMTGNTVVDALRYIEHKLDGYALPLELTPGKKMILVTAHRRENFGAPMEHICKAIVEITQKFADVEVVYPVHPNPNVREKVNKWLRDKERIRLLKPLNYIEFLVLMRKAHLILTDSGGVQEEAPTYKKPVLVMRLVTERPEGVEAGVAKIVGTDRKRIVDEVSLLLQDKEVYRRMSMGANPYGDGFASRRICEFLKSLPHEK
jgi:UDP-N-acetylglucosamine 2-epimerase (non-hydrolysing)